MIAASDELIKLTVTSIKKQKKDESKPIIEAADPWSAKAIIDKYVQKKEKFAKQTSGAGKELKRLDLPFFERVCRITQNLRAK